MTGTLLHGSSRTPDAVCAASVDLARAAAVEVGGTGVGEHLGVAADGDRVATHLFGSAERGYPGWRWAVTVARASRARAATVSEVALLPGPEAVLAPEWVPWSERLRPGDLGVGDLLPTDPDDDRLVPAYVLSDDDSGYEPGVGRVRVLSPVGRDEAAQRWYGSDRGPKAPIARSAPAHCGTCGFFLPIAGSLGALFGVCGNEFAPDDGLVVAVDHGCGAHSEALVEAAGPLAEPLPIVLDDAEVEVVERAPDDGDNAEALGHS